MKSELNRLILLGFICQGLSWDDYVMPLASIALWFVALQARARTKGLGQGGDIAGMILGSTAAFVLAHPLGASNHFFIGHGLTLLQASRLTRPLNRREQIFSFIVALGQVGVACTVILDYRFIPILFAALSLVPKALAELEAGRFRKTAERLPTPRFSWSVFVTLMLVLVVVFFGSPRGLISAALPAPSIGGAPGNLLDDMLDPSFGGQANSAKVILQIEGRQLGYLRMFCLTLFEEGVWRSEPAPRRFYLPPPGKDMPTNLVARAVRVKNANYLNKKIPHDGQVVALEGNFFRQQRIDENDVIHCLSLWNTANNAYRFWINSEPHAAPLNRRRQRLLTRAPALSPAVTQWLEERTAGTTNELDAARRLESWLSDNFEYRLGTPNLNRLNALEEFILRERRGHCERFASALALLLRSRGIPTRVVVGFVPGPLNWFSGWRNVRFNDAHAWTEAWFPDEGWVRFDATPRADISPAGGRLAELLDALDVMWYVNFVNYNNSAQQGLIQSAGAALSQGLAIARAHAAKIVALILGAALFQIWRRRTPGPRSKETTTKRRIQFAEDCYGRLLKMFARRGIVKPPDQTPREFAQALPGGMNQLREPLLAFTEEFQRIRYGHDTTDPSRLQTLFAEIETTLKTNGARPISFYPGSPRFK